MSNPFATVVSKAEIKNQSDNLGGGFVKESAAYPVTIKCFYAGEAASGAKSVTFEAELADGSTFEHTEYVTSGREKGGKNTYIDKDGKEQYLPGYSMMNAMALLLTHKELSEMDWEEKIVKVYDSASKSKINKPTMCGVEAHGKQVILGLIKQTENKSVKNNAGKYIETAETRDVNILDKVFDFESKRTIAEFRDQKAEAEFYEPWVAKNTGVTRDKSKKGSVAGAPKAAAGNDKPKTSLFG